MSADPQARAAAILDAHAQYDAEADFACACGWKPSDTAWEEDFGEYVEHCTHVAAALAEAGLLAGPCACSGSGLYPNEVPGVGTEWVACPDCHVAELTAAREAEAFAVREKVKAEAALSQCKEELCSTEALAARAELAEAKAECDELMGDRDRWREWAGDIAAVAERRGAVAALRDLADDIDITGYGWISVVAADRFRSRIYDRAARLAEGDDL